MVTITYIANGGEGEMKPQAVESGFEVKLNANTFTKDGSDFTGWNEAKDGSGKAYADGATVTPTGNLTLYAQWQAKSTPENPGTEDPDPENPGTEDPDPENPGTEDPDPENPGTEDPESPVVLENHITNLVLIKAVEDAYRQSSGSEFGWTKTEDGYVDMTVEANQTAVTGVESLDLSGQGLTSSEGLEYFTGLKQLTLSATKDGSDKQNALTELDVSALTALTSLVLNGNPLTALPDLTNQSALVSLNAASCGLTAVSGLPASLMVLNLSDNELTALDVSALTDLETLLVGNNLLTQLDVSALTDLVTLSVYNNALTELNIAGNTALTSLICFANRMSALDITSVTAFSEDSQNSLLACGLQTNNGSSLQDLTLTATLKQKNALASLFPAADDGEMSEIQASNVGVVWNVPYAVGEDNFFFLDFSDRAEGNTTEPVVARGGHEDNKKAGTETFNVAFGDGSVTTAVKVAYEGWIEPNGDGGMFADLNAATTFSEDLFKTFTGEASLTETYQPIWGDAVTLEDDDPSVRVTLSGLPEGSYKIGLLSVRKNNYYNETSNRISATWSITVGTVSDSSEIGKKSGGTDVEPTVSSHAYTVNQENSSSEIWGFAFSWTVTPADGVVEVLIDGTCPLNALRIEKLSE